MTAPPDTSPPRPTLEQPPGRPDVLVRLRRRRVWWVDSQISEADDALSAEMDRTLEDDLRDAIATIEGLRAANLRHCEDERLLKEARARVAELEALIRAMRKAASDRVDYFDKTADTLAGDPRMGLPHMRSVARREAAERIVADMSLIVIESGLIGPAEARPSEQPAPQPQEQS